MNRLIFFLCLLIGIFGGLRKDANAFTNKLKGSIVCKLIL